jgi:hypothetical protein
VVGSFSESFAHTQSVVEFELLESTVGIAKVDARCLDALSERKIVKTFSLRRTVIEVIKERMVNGSLDAMDLFG